MCESLCTIGRSTAFLLLLPHLRLQPNVNRVERLIAQILHLVMKGREVTRRTGGGIDLCDLSVLVGELQMSRTDVNDHAAGM